MSEWKITDDLLARYIDGQTTAEEDARIEAALAADPARMDEFMQMADATRLAGAEPVAPVDMEKALADVRQTVKDNHTSKHRNLWLRVAAVAGAAAAVLLLVVLLVKPFRDTPTFVAQNDADNQETSVTVETGVEDDNSALINHHQPENVIENQTDINIAADNSGIVETQTSQPAAKKTSEGEALTVHKIDKNYASTSENDYLSVEKPSKADYRLLCRNLDKTFTFQWKASNIKTLTFTLKNKQGMTLAEMNDVQADHFTVSYRKLYPENYLLWCVSVVYNDGKREQRSGVLQIDYDIH